jgi:hypothetical protein
MSVTEVLDRGSLQDGDVNVRIVGQLSAIGALADQVLADLIRAEAGLMAVQSSNAIANAAQLFRNAATATARPANLWQRTDLTEALRRMTSGPVLNEVTTLPKGTDGSFIDHLEGLASALTAAYEGRSTDDDLQRIRTEFTSIATATMDATLIALRNRQYSTSWLTA